MAKLLRSYWVFKNLPSPGKWTLIPKELQGSIIIIIIDNRGINARWCLTPLLLSLPTAAYLGQHGLTPAGLPHTTAQCHLTILGEAVLFCFKEVWSPLYRDWWSTSSHLNWQKTSEYWGEMSAASMTVTEKTRVELGCRWSGNFIFTADDELSPFISSVSAETLQYNINICMLNKCTKHQFIHLTTATLKNSHIENSKNYKRWYCPHHTDCVSMCYHSACDKQIQGGPKKTGPVWALITQRQLVVERRLIHQKFQNDVKNKWQICIVKHLNILCLIYINIRHPRNSANWL